MTRSAKSNSVTYEHLRAVLQTANKYTDTRLTRWIP